MRFTVGNTVMKNVLRLLSSVEKNPYPISLSAQLDAGSLGCITVDTLEGTKYVSVSFAGDVVEEGTVLFSSKYLPCFDVDHETITVVTKKDGFGIRTVGEYMVPYYSGEAQSLPSLQPLGSATFALSDIKQLFKRVLFAVGDDSDPRHNFRCVYLDCRSDAMSVIGRGRRLIAVSRISKGSPYTGRFVLPKGGCYVLNKLDGDLVTLTFYEQAIRFSTSGEIVCDIHMPAWNEKFLEVSELLDIKGRTLLTGDKALLLSSIAAVRKVTERLQITMQYDGSGVKQQPRFYGREDLGAAQFKSFIPASWDGDELKISVNAHSLYRAVEQVDGSEVGIDFTNNMGTFSVKGGGDEYQAVLSPYSTEEKQ